MTKSLFCAHCQLDTEQTFRVSADGKELIAACACGREIKFSSALTAVQIRAAFAAHKVANTGQVKVDETSVPVAHPVLKALADV